MKFINNVKNKLTVARKLIAVSYKLKAVRGFTLIETLVAISILMIAVVSPLTIAQKGLSSAFYAKDQIIASYLAQDAIEYLRNLSDQNVENGKNWLTGYDGGKDIKTPCDTLCKVDTYTNTVALCTDSGGDGICDGVPLYKNNDGIYTQVTTAGSPTTFTRSVKVVKIGTDDKEALITVKMSWFDKGKSREFTVNTRIFNWR